MTAYLLRGVAAGPDVLALPALDRLRPAGPWAVRDWEGGALVFRQWEHPHGVAATDLGTPRDCADGLVYFPPKAMPTSGELLRDIDSLGPTIAVGLSCGEQILIPLAQAAPRRLLFSGGGRVGEPVGPYVAAVQALVDHLDLRDELERIASVKEATDLDRAAVRDAAIKESELALRAVFLAVQGAYRVTEELLDDLGWLTTADVAPIAMAAQGIDPKAARPRTGAGDT